VPVIVKKTEHDRWSPHDSAFVQIRCAVVRYSIYW